MGEALPYVEGPDVAGPGAGAGGPFVRNLRMLMGYEQPAWQDWPDAQLVLSGRAICPFTGAGRWLRETLPSGKPKASV